MIIFIICGAMFSPKSGETVPPAGKHHFLKQQQNSLTQTYR